MQASACRKPNWIRPPEAEISGGAGSILSILMMDLLSLDLTPCMALLASENSNKQGDFNESS